MTPTEYELRAINIKLATLASVRKSHAAWAEHHRAAYHAAREAGRMYDAEYAMRAWGRCIGQMDELRARIADLISQRYWLAGV